MVIRTFLILILLSSGMAQSQNRLINKKISHAYKLYLNKEYGKAYLFLEGLFPVNKLDSLNPKVLLLLGLIEQKRGNFERSNLYLNRNLSVQFSELDQELMKRMEADELEDFDAPKELLQLYYAIAQNSFVAYKKTELLEYYTKSKRFFSICSQLEYSEDEADEYLDKLDALKKYIDEHTKRFDFFLSSGVLLFQESLKLKNTNTNTEEKLISSARGYCVGGGMKYSDAHYGFYLNTCAYLGTSTASTSSNSYFQDQVPQNGVLANLGGLMRPNQYVSHIGLSIPVFYRVSNYDEPSGYEVDSESRLMYGLSLDTEVMISNTFGLLTQFANLNGGNMFLVQGILSF